MDSIGQLSLAPFQDSSAFISSPFVVLLAHEALERRETSVQDEFEVAELPLGQTNVGELLRLLNELLAKGSIANVEIFEDTAVGRVGL